MVANLSAATLALLKDPKANQAALDALGFAPEMTAGEGGGGEGQNNQPGTPTGNLLFNNTEPGGGATDVFDKDGNFLRTNQGRGDGAIGWNTLLPALAVAAGGYLGGSYFAGAGEVGATAATTAAGTGVEVGGPMSVGGAAATTLPALGAPAGGGGVGAVLSTLLGSSGLGDAFKSVATGVLISTLLGSKQPGTPATPTPTAPTAPPAPQVAQAPTAADTVNAMKGTGQSGGSPGAAQTMLTGSGGVNPTTLLLGKKTLLGA